MNRKILLDTETTGFNYKNSDKIVEIAAVEILDDYKIGKSFHFYINPEKDIPEDAFRVHGINNEKVKDCKTFKEISEDFLIFIQDSLIIAHNAEFDRGFLNAELEYCKKDPLPKERFIDTLMLAKEKFPREKVSLDELCKKFKVSLDSRKDYHGALIDVMLLGDVYKNLIKGQSNIFEENKSIEMNKKIDNKKQIDYLVVSFPKRGVILTEEVQVAHKNFIENKIKNSIWFK